jgi:hypothetical protein
MIYGMSVYVEKTAEESKQLIDTYMSELRTMSVEEFVKRWETQSMDKSHVSEYHEARALLSRKYYGSWLAAECRRDIIRNIEAAATHMRLNIDQRNVHTITSAQHRFSRLYVSTFSTIRSDACVVLSLATINYAYIYFDASGKDPDPTHVCLGRNYKSADGEYRPYVVEIAIIMDVRARLIAMFEALESAMPHQIQSERSRTFYARSTEHVFVMENMLREEPVMLACTWMMCAHMHFTGEPMPKDYDDELWRGGGDLLAAMVAKFGEAPLRRAAAVMALYTRTARDPSGHVWNGDIRADGLIAGQKLIPLAVSDLGEHVFDPTSPVWRELRITQLMSDVVLNGGGNMFPLFMGWFVVSGININLFRNENMREVMRLSDEAAAGEPTTHRILKSDVSLGIITEYMGPPPTIADIIADAEGYLCRVAWGCGALNARGIVHGDLHLKNVVYHTDMRPPAQRDFHLFICTVLKRVFVSPHSPKYPVIIDFSRSFVLADMTSEEVARMVALVNMFVNGTAFERLATRKLRAAFTAFTAFDLLVHTDRIITACGDTPVPPIVTTIHDAAIEWIGAPLRGHTSFNLYAMTLIYPGKAKVPKGASISDVTTNAPASAYSSATLAQLPRMTREVHMQRTADINEISTPMNPAKKHLGYQINAKCAESYERRAAYEEAVVYGLTIGQSSSTA